MRQAAAQPEVRGAGIRRAMGLEGPQGELGGGWGVGSRPLQLVCLLSRAPMPLPSYCLSLTHTQSVSRGHYQSNQR